MMSKFFVPASWENLADAMKFRSKIPLGNAGDGISAVQAAQTKLKQTKSKKPKVRGTAITNTKTARVGKIKGIPNGTKPAKLQNGRIVKPKSAKNVKLQSEVMTSPVPPLALPPAKTLSTTKIKNNKMVKQKKRKQLLQPNTAVEEAVQVSAAKPLISLGTTNTDNESVAPASSEDIGLKVFENSLKQQLLGGRFRYINEQLYTMDSTEAEEFFKSDAEAFDAYHAGYQQQVEKWPMNPLDRIIKMINRLPKVMEIVDFGCGQGRLAQSVPNKVYSMDLVSTHNDIIACDMAHTPLNDQSVDIAVYCLSLMGTNLKDYLLEANRVLRPNGLVIIAEIQSRFDDVRQFIRGLQACGFELVKKDVTENLFYFFQFKKKRNVGKVALIPPFSLQPCLYRKR